MKINLYSVLKKSTIGLLLFYVGLVFSQVTTPECPVCEDPVNVWYKVSTFEPDKGKIVRLDMRKGQAFTDHQYIYISVKDLDTGEFAAVAGDILLNIIEESLEHDQVEFNTENRNDDTE